MINLKNNKLFIRIKIGFVLNGFGYVPVCTSVSTYPIESETGCQLFTNTFHYTTGQLLYTSDKRITQIKT
jgi:hypothetical protein